MKRWIDQASIGLIVVMFALTALVYTRLPPQIAVHFDVHGEANGWMPRASGAFLLPMVTAATWATLKFGGGFLGRNWRARYEASPIAESAFLTLALMGALQTALLYVALTARTSIATVFSLSFGVFCICIALLFPRLRRNPWIGIRLPWTLASDEVWSQTHRIGGYAFAAGGLAMVVAGALGCAACGIVIFSAALICTIAYSGVFAWRLAKR